MPRPKRIFERNAIYHVYNRANNKRGINLTNTTFDYFCSMLSELKQKYEIEIPRPLPLLAAAVVPPVRGWASFSTPAQLFPFIAQHDICRLKTECVGVYIFGRKCRP